MTYGDAMPDDETKQAPADAMGDEELNEAVARAMGAPEVTDPADLGNRVLHDRDTVVLCRFEGDTGWTPILPRGGKWSPATDMAAAWLVEETVARHGPAVQVEYAWAVWRATQGVGVFMGSIPHCWLMIHATPRQRCLAALQAFATKGAPHAGR